MAKRRQFTDEFRGSAVTLLKAAGWPKKKGALATTAKRLGVSAQNLSNWARGAHNPVPQNVLEEKECDLAELLDREIRAALGQMENKRDFASYKDLSVAAAIMIEKKQLLTGQPTERVGVDFHAEDAVRAKQKLELWKQQKQSPLPITGPTSLPNGLPVKNH